MTSLVMNNGSKLGQNVCGCFRPPSPGFPEAKEWRPITFCSKSSRGHFTHHQMHSARGVCVGE